MSELLVEAEGLVKAYGDFRAVDGLDLHLAEGEVYGFLGPNGSGKSTTILMMLGLTEPTAGLIRVVGHDPTREPLDVKRLVGYLPESVGFYADLSGRENLMYTANLNRINRDDARMRIDELLEMVELTEARDQVTGQYSRGMRQRLGLADVLLKRPKVIILDDLERVKSRRLPNRSQRPCLSKKPLRHSLGRMIGRHNFMTYCEEG